MAEDFGRSMRRIGSKIVQRFDQELQELRDNYTSLEPEEQRAFRKWIEDLVTVLDSEPQHYMRLSVKITIDNSVTDEQGEVVYVGGAKLSPRVMLNSLRAWDAGEDYTPPLGGICG